MKKFKEYLNEEHSYASTQLELTHPHKKRLFHRDVISIDRNDLHPDEKIQDDPHVTIVYGFRDNQFDDILEMVYGKFKPISLNISRINYFEKPDMDVLYFEIEENLQLLEMYETLKSIPNNSTYPQYNPHMTIAYLKRGMGPKYLNKIFQLNNSDLYFDTLIFSSTLDEKIPIPLMYDN